MSEEIIKIQTQLSFQEDSIHALNDVITKQQKQIDQLKASLRLLQKNIEDIQSRQSEMTEDSPPPHY